MLNLLSTSHVEGRVAVCPVTLDASSSSALLTDVTSQFPSGSRNIVDAIDRFQKYLFEKY